jgi:hypothetical protein
VRVNGVPPEDSDPIEEAERLDDLLPGDVLDLWLEENMVIQTLFRAWETMDNGTVKWQWMFLDDGSLLEVSPDGLFRYKEHRVLKQGTALYEEIVAQDGALVRFEERVREDTVGRRPVHLTIDEKEYRITSTGTCAVERLGEEPEPMSWRFFDRNPSENVYFGLVDVEDESNVGLGLWTAHVCLSFGKEMDRSDITNIYRNRQKS